MVVIYNIILSKIAQKIAAFGSGLLAAAGRKDQNPFENVNFF